MPKRLYVLDILEGKWKPGDLVEKVFDVCGFWKPQWVGIEDIGAGLAIESMFISEMQRTDRRIPYRKIKMPGINRVSSKESRMAPLHAHAQHYGIWVHEDGRHEALVEELLRFGVAEHEDLADALGMRGVDLYSWTPADVKQEKPELTYVPGRMPITGKDVIRRAQARVKGRRDAPWKRVQRQIA
jgi:predicted phage terminase large subunit-like protein